MSASMLSDDRKMDQVNPFATGGPGAWSNPYPYTAPGPDKESASMWDTADVSPMCLSDISAGGICENPIANCPMARALEPTREIVPDADEAGSLDALYGTKLIPKEPVPTLAPRYCADGECPTKKAMNSWWFPLVIIVLIAIVLGFRFK